MPLSGSPSSPKRWRTARTALGLWPACHRQEPWIPEGGSPSIAPRFASLGLEGGASPFGLHRTLPGDSRPVFNSRRAQQLVPFNSHPGTSVGVAALVQRWLRWLDSVQRLEVAATTLRAERGRRRDPHAASKGTTTRGIGSALFTGQAKALDAIRTVIRTLIAPLCRSCSVMPSRWLRSQCPTPTPLQTLE